MSLNKIKLGIIRSPRIFAIAIFFGLTGTWAIMEPFVSVYITTPDKYWFLAFLILPTIFFACWKVYPKDEITFTFHNTNTKVKILFGDLFKQKGVIVIGVNEFFDSSLGKPVSPNSLHGYFIQKILGGKQSLFDSAVESELVGTPFETIDRAEGKNKRYSIGTTVKIDFAEKNYLLFALSKTNERFEAYSTPSIILEALNGLMNKARSECNGDILVLPLVGTGLSRSGISPKYIIELILIAILNSTKEGEVSNEINIILRPELMKEIDLNDLERKWK